jgi:phosphohistidine phosphatase
MQLCLIRHADALPLTEGVEMTDAERPLSDKGWRQCEQLALALQRFGLEPGPVVVSPLLRSRQTAEGLLRHWIGTRPEVSECRALAPGGKPRKLERFIRGRESETVTLIGHQPDLGHFAGWLIGARSGHIRFGKASAALIHFEAGPRRGQGMLHWLITANWCAVVAGPRAAQAG